MRPGLSEGIAQLRSASAPRRSCISVVVVTAQPLPTSETRNSGSTAVAIDNDPSTIRQLITTTSATLRVAAGAVAAVLIEDQFAECQPFGLLPSAMTMEPMYNSCGQAVTKVTNFGTVSHFLPIDSFGPGRN